MVRGQDGRQETKSTQVMAVVEKKKSLESMVTVRAKISSSYIKTAAV